MSFPLSWEDLDRVSPVHFTVHTAAGLIAGGDPRGDLLPAAQPLSPGLAEEGHQVPVAQVQALHEGKRRARAARKG